MVDTKNKLEKRDIDEINENLALAGLAANNAAQANVFDEYRATKSENTLQAHDQDLHAFERFLSTLLDAQIQGFRIQPQAWRNITWGLVEAFKKQQIRDGYALSTINRRLSTIRVYARLAHKADVLSLDEMKKIRSVSGYAGKEAKNMNAKRRAAGIATRQYSEDGAVIKKEENVQLSTDDVHQLLYDHDDTPQGRRDAVLMALLLEHGLRCSEIVDLKVRNIRLARGQLRFYRAKVDKTQTHSLTQQTQQALQKYFDAGDIPSDPNAPLLRASHRSGSLLEAGLSRQAISQRVKQFGLQLGIERLSAHDCRHNWATRAARGGTSPFALQEAGGWNSLAMPRHYVEESSIANADVNLDDT